MGDRKISAMPAAATLSGAEIVPLVQNGANVKATAQQLVDLAVGVMPDVSDSEVTKDGATYPRPISAIFADAHCPEDFGYDENAQAGLQACLTYCGTGVSRMRLRKREYLPTAELAVATDGSDCDLDFEAPIGSKINWGSSSPTSGGSCFQIGDHTAGVTDLGAGANPLDASITAFSKTIDLNNAIDTSAIVPGTLLAIMDIGNYSLTGGITVDGSNDYYRQGEMVEVESIAANNVITTTKRMFGAYSSGNTNIRIYRLPRRLVNMHGGGEFAFKQGAVASGLTVFDAYHGRLDDLVLGGTQYNTVTIARCFGGRFNRLVMRDYQANITANYGMVVYGSYDCQLIDAHVDVPRHGFTTSGGNRLGYGVNRLCGTINGTFRSRVSACLDQHGPSDRCFFINPTTHGHVTLGGSRGKLWGGEIHSMLAGSEIGVCVSLRDRIDSNFKIGGGVSLYQEAALDSGNAMLMLDSLGILAGGRILLDGIEFNQEKNNSGTRGAAKIALASGSDREVSLVMNNLTGTVAEGITPTTHNVDIVGQTNGRFISIAGRNWNQLIPRFTDVRCPDSEFVNQTCVGATQEALLVLADDSATEAMDISIDGFKYRENAGGGLRIGGTTEGDSVRAFVKNGIAVDNASTSDATAQSRGSIEIVNCLEAACANLDLGDGQSSQTQTRRLVATNVTRLSLPPSVRSRGVILPDVYSGVDELLGGAPVLLAASGVAVALTGTTNETALATIAIKGRSLGPNGIIEVETIWSWTNSANNKTPRVRLGGISGTEFLNAVATTTGHGAFRRTIQNRNSNSSQIGSFAANITNTYSVGAGSPASATINTANDQDLVISGQLANSGETITLEGYRVWVTFKHQ